MTSQQFLVCDSSTLANFKQWAQAISTFFTTAGWTQSTDTGQVNWSTIVSVPGSGAYVYEVWQPNDGLTTFYAKVEYGNVSGVNSPSLRLTVSTGTNGSGTPTGFVMGPYNTNANSFTAPSTTTQFECNFSGAAGRIGAMMWRNGTNNCQQFFAIERSINTGGSYTSAHVTLVTCGIDSGPNYFNQQTLVFGVGIGPASSNVAARGSTSLGGLIVRATALASSATTAFNGSIPMDTIAPSIGFYDYALTCCGAGRGVDFVEGVTFTVTLYGSTRTYMPSKNSVFASALYNPSSTGSFCMRYD